MLGPSQAPRTPRCMLFVLSWSFAILPTAANPAPPALLLSPVAPSIAATQRPEARSIALRTSGIWPVRRQWTAALEQRYSAWIAHLFRPVDGERNRGWRVLHDVLRNPSRNALYNQLGYREDDKRSETRVTAVADCGDTPYMLRAYFAWKHGLPFRFGRCDRGNAVSGPSCRGHVDNLTPDFDHIPHPVARFNAFVARAIAWGVHSGTMRTRPEDDASDFYPIPLNREAIRPGTVFVDTGGHAFVISQWDETGLFGVDGHPDKTVTRRAFSRKHFPYAAAVDTGGFKAFRPIAVEDGQFIAATNRSLGRRFSVEQYAFSSSNRFFEHMTALLAR